jgi:hypothetical protein
MRDGGKGDKRRPLIIPEEQFNAQWDAIFNNNKLVEQAPWQPGYEDAAMTTFTTQDRQDAEKYRDITIKGFNFRFVKEGDDWVCKMPDWLLKNAEDLFK